MDMPKNAFKAGLKAGRQQIGIWNTITGPVMAETLAVAGFDWVLLDTEHALTDVPDLMGMMQAVAPYPSSSVIRAAGNDTVLIKRLLDLGAQTLMIPYVQNADEAAMAVRAMRYAPRGVRGVSSISRGSRFGAVPDYVAHAEKELCLIVQVESVEAVERIPEIAAVDGVDAIFVGPADLSASMGHHGKVMQPEVIAMVERAIKAIVATGTPAGILVTDHDLARKCMGWGTTFTAVGIDQSLLNAGLRSLRAAFA